MSVSPSPVACQGCHAPSAPSTSTAAAMASQRRARGGTARAFKSRAKSVADWWRSAGSLAKPVASNRVQPGGTGRSAVTISRGSDG